MIRAQRCVWTAAAVSLLGVMMGCGTPGAPQPPSLNLPERVTDLAATRAGNRVSLTWTMPRKNTDRLALKDTVAVRVCRMEAARECVDAGGYLTLAPGAAAAFTETLPAPLAAGAPRALSYLVELKNRNGRSAGLSNAAVVLAGAPPAPVAGMTAEVRKNGVVLHWTPGNANAAVRLERKLLTPPAAKQQQGFLASAPEPVVQKLLIEAGAGRAIDKTIRFGEDYEYRAQRVSRVTAEGKVIELDGELSPPVRVEVRDVFPPEVPTGLAAVASLGENASETAIDLSWQPATDADVAGYIVYRREGPGAWQRISPPQPVIGPAFHDVHVEPGRAYRYAVSAVDQGGHESARSAETEETVPNP